MSLEQRIEALEKKVANLTLPNGKTEELAKMMRDTVTEVINNALRPGGYLQISKENATKNSLIAFEIQSGTVYIRPEPISASD